MTQISKGDTFSNGQQVDALRLNSLVDSATLLVGAITDQPNITPNTLVATDSTIVNDGGVLKEATIGDFLNSNLPITTSAINGVAGADIVLTPASGREVDVAGNFQVIGNSITTGAASVGGNLTLTGQINGTGAVRVASGTTAQRPASPIAGSFRFNTTTNTLEVFNGTEWITTAAVYNNLPVYGVYEFVSNGWGYVASGTLGGHTGPKYQTTSTVSKTNKERWELRFSVSALLSDLQQYAIYGSQTYTIKLIGSNGVTYATNGPFIFQFLTETVFEGGGPEGGGSNVTYNIDDFNRTVGLVVVLDTSVVFSGITLAVVVTTSNSPTVSRVNPSPSTSQFPVSGGVLTVNPSTSVSAYTMTNTVAGHKWVAP
jgi:hypothetical protein